MALRTSVRRDRFPIASTRVAFAISCALLISSIGSTTPRAPSRDSSIVPKPAFTGPPVPAGEGRAAHSASRVGRLYQDSGDSSLPGDLSRTIFPNYNAWLSTNFPGTVWNWIVGSPAYVPTTQTIWLPIQQSTNPLGTPPISDPAILFNVSNDQFRGFDFAAQNASAFVYDPDNDLLYFSDVSNDSVGAISPESGAFVGRAIPVGTAPSAMALNPVTDELYVANAGSNNVTVINVSIAHVVVPGIGIGPGTAPRSLAIDVRDRVLFVASSGVDNLTSINTMTNQWSGSVVLSSTPGCVAYAWGSGVFGLTLPKSNQSLLYYPNTALDTVVHVGRDISQIIVNDSGTGFLLSNQSSANLESINATTATITDSGIPVGMDVTELVADSSNGDVLAWSAGNRSFTVLDSSNYQTVEVSPSLGPEPESLAFSESLDRVFVADAFGGRVLVLNASTGVEASPSLWFGSAALSVAIGSSGQVLYVGTNGGVVAAWATNGTVFAYRNLPGANTALTIDAADGLVWLANADIGVTALYSANFSIAYSIAISVPPLIQQNVLALDPTMSELFIVNESSHEIDVVSSASGNLIATGVDPGSGATAIAFDPADGGIYVVGSNLTIINPLDLQVEAGPIPLVAHALATGLAYDPSRQDLYVTSALGPGAEYAGAVSVIGGSNLQESEGSQAIVLVGELPTTPLVVSLPESTSLSTSTIWVPNLDSGTISEIGSPPEITFLSVSPDPVDVSEQFQVLLGLEGGAGNNTIRFSGLPSGCGSADVTVLNCTSEVAGNFTILASVTDALGQTAESSGSLSIGPLLTVKAVLEKGSTTSLDLGQTIWVSAVTSGGSPPYTYEWSFGDGSSATGAAASHAYSEAGTYLLNVTVGDSAQNDARAVLVLQVWSLPISSIDISPSNTTDVDLPLLLSAVVVGGTSPSSENWTFGDGNSASGFSTSHEWASPGNFSVEFRYRDTAGAWSNRSTTVVVYPALTASFFSGSSPGSSVLAGATVNFTAEIQGGHAPYFVSWSFGDGATSVGQQVDHVYANAGQFSVNVTVEDSAGARISESLPIAISSISGQSDSGLTTGSQFDLGIFFGFLAGLALAMVILYVAGRNPRRPRISPTHVTRPEGPTPEWKEE
jgi:DNA-binding beta-propeller fold protein YncE/PKD repeat protein